MIKEITILPGKDKNDHKENFDQITLKAGETISIVGPYRKWENRLYHRYRTTGTRRYIYRAIYSHKRKKARGRSKI